MDLFRILRHIFFWAVFFAVIIYFTGGKAVNPDFLLVDIPITLFYVYVSAYIIIPYFLEKGRYLLLGASLVIFSLMLSYIRLINYDYFYYSIFSPGLSEGAGRISLAVLLLNSKDFSFGLFIFLSVKYTLQWFKIEKSKVEMENEQIESEIRLMKTQVDHHFLFNTLNNIYSLSVTEPSRTKSAVKKLWGLLDFLVNQANFKEIRIERELKLISDYVELERLRYGDRLDFEFNIERALKDYRIPPLILYPFIENCFKHGTALDPGNPWIKIDISELEDRIRFIAKNSKKASYLDPKITEEQVSTLERIRKRLNFQLPGRFKLRIEDKPDEYMVQLDIFY
jgi:sensor histidine kinase YesM